LPSALFRWSDLDVWLNMNCVGFSVWEAWKNVNVFVRAPLRSLTTVVIIFSKIKKDGEVRVFTRKKVAIPIRTNFWRLTQKCRLQIKYFCSFWRLLLTEKDRHNHINIYKVGAAISPTWARASTRRWLKGVFIMKEVAFIDLAVWFHQPYPYRWICMHPRGWSTNAWGRILAGWKVHWAPFVHMITYMCSLLIDRYYS
jgi:hypothetical protein